MQHLLVASSVLLAACASDVDEPRGREPYGGAIDWPCFEGPRECWCPGLGPGDEASSSEPEVEACSHRHCYVYRIESTWMCSCEPFPFMPKSRWKEPAPIAACPPE